MKILAVALPVIGLAGGLVGGHFLHPTPEPGPEDAPVHEAGGTHPAAPETGDHDAAPAYKASKAPAPAHGPTEYAKISKQFIVPVIADEKVSSLVVVNLAVEVDQGQSGLVVEQEPKLRDEFLKVLFNHAQSGGFGGDFTKAHLMDDLRSSLHAAATGILGATARQVLLTSIVRQDY